MKKYSLLGFVFILLVACGSKTDQSTTNDERMPVIDYDINQALNELITIWNDAHNIRDSVLFTSLYAAELNYYGEPEIRDSSIHRKMKFFQGNPDFKQEILGEVNLQAQEDGNVRCDFIKQISYQGKESKHQAYLIYKQFEDRFRIIKESDLKTDQFFESKNQ